jgi:hypothetical protein
MAQSLLFTSPLDTYVRKPHQNVAFCTLSPALLLHLTVDFLPNCLAIAPEYSVLTE